MAGITLAQAQAQLDSYLAAETKVLTSQEYRIADRGQKRALLSDIQAGIELWDRRVRELTQVGRGRGRAITVSPR